MCRRVASSLALLLLLSSAGVLAPPALAAGNLPGHDTGAAPADTFRLDARNLDPIRFSRVEDGRDTVGVGTPMPSASRLTRFSLKVRPGETDTRRRGLYGLGSFAQPSLAVEGGALGPHRLYESIPDLHDGLAYSAGVNIEHDEAVVDSMPFVSSSLLGVSYGRLGRVWYGGVDVNLEQFSSDLSGEEHSDMVSLDVTTGRRLGWTGLSSASPLWLLTLQGNFDVQELENDEVEVTPDWYLNPSLFWQNPAFTFSAQVQVPVQLEPADRTDKPDYRLRAVFEKQF